MDDGFDEWEQAQKQKTLSSSNQTEKSCSSVKLSSSSSSINFGFLIDNRDGQKYKTITIGTQTWMADNLNFKTTNSYCYNDDTSYCTKYGHLYTWATAMDSAGTWSINGKSCGSGNTCASKPPVQGICPSGWHLPSKAELETLITAVGGQSAAIKALKTTSGWSYYNNNNGNGTNDYSFSALPAGNRLRDGRYICAGTNTDFWSSSENSNIYAYEMSLSNINDKAYLITNYNKSAAYSVRCLKDEPTEQKSSSSVKSSSSTDKKISSSSHNKASSSSTKSSSSVKETSSSSKVTSSSSLAKSSSSSAKAVSSSSKKNEVSSSSENVKLSSSGKASWAYLNPAISYGEITDDRDRQVYKTVKIGTQTWMAENLNYRTGNSYCHDDSATYCEKYGRYYTWASANTSCPNNWHLPTKEEFETLFSTVGGQSSAGIELKTINGWKFDGNGLDNYGFSGYPAGWRENEDQNYDMLYNAYESVYAYFWISSEYDNNNAYYMRLNYEGDAANLGGYNKKNYGMSVRCIKD